MRCNLKILAIGAHPDDIEVGCGGTLLYLRQMHGASICNFVMTFGEANEDLRIRFEEQAASDKIIGVDETVYATLPDTEIPLKQAIDKIEKVMGQVNPDVIFTHSLADTHQDHRTLHDATISACRNRGNLLCYESFSTPADCFSPSILVDIENVLDLKCDAIAAHVSQASRLNLVAYVRVLSEFRAHRTGYKHVEAFEPHKFIWR